jgi:hypothetical protein
MLSHDLLFADLRSPFSPITVFVMKIVHDFFVISVYAEGCGKGVGVEMQLCSVYV